MVRAGPATSRCVVNDVHEVAVHVPNRRGADARSQGLVAPDNRYAFGFQLVGGVVEIVDLEDKELVADRAQMLWRFGEQTGYRRHAPFVALQEFQQRAASL